MIGAVDFNKIPMITRDNVLTMQTCLEGSMLSNGNTYSKIRPMNKAKNFNVKVGYQTV